MKQPIEYPILHILLPKNATPEENAHIEAYHGILKKEVFKRVDYRTFGEIEQILKGMFFSIIILGYMVYWDALHQWKSGIRTNI